MNYWLSNIIATVLSLLEANCPLAIGPTCIHMLYEAYILINVGTCIRASDFPRSRKSRGIADLKRNP